MVLRLEKLIPKGKTLKVLILSVLLLVLIFAQYPRNNSCYVPFFSTGSLNGSKGFQVCYRGGDVLITVRMMNSTSPITGELTLFYDASNGIMIGGAYTDSNGYASLNWSIPSDYNLGPAVINASCPDRGDAIPVYVDLMIEATTQFENLTYPASAYAGENLTVEAALTDNLNNTLPNQQVYLTDQQNNTLNTSTTDNFGCCSLLWMIPANFTPGTYTFQIVFEGDQLYGPAEEEFNVSIQPPPQTPTLFENLTYPTSVYPGGCLTVEANLTDNCSNPLPNQQVYLADQQNNTLNTSTTDNLGSCSLLWTVPTNFTPGTYTFQIGFGGDQLYSPAEEEFNVTILQFIGILSVTLNATAVEPGALISVVVEVNSSDSLVSVSADGFPLGTSGGGTWSGVVQASSQPGTYAVSVVLYYNGTPCANDSSACYVVQQQQVSSGFPGVAAFLLLGMSGGSQIEGWVLLAPLSAVSLFSAAIIWRRRSRQPSFSRDYTLYAGSPP
jgi:5-hydroxyisourate hydrolase-like protein (transthyretin family)